MKFLYQRSVVVLKRGNMSNLTDRSLPAQESAPPARLVVPDEVLGGLLPLRNYLEVSGWGCGTVDRAHKGSEESGVIETVCAHADQIAPVSCPVIGSHPEHGKGEAKETEGGDNHHACGEMAHHGNH